MGWLLAGGVVAVVAFLFFVGLLMTKKETGSWGAAWTSLGQRKDGSPDPPATGANRKEPGLVMTDRPHSAPKKSLSQRIGVVIGTGILLALPVWLAILLAIHFDDVWAFVVSLWEESKHISYEECIERGGHVVRGECVLP